MKATFENHGTIIDIGTGLVCGERDTTGGFSGAYAPNTVGLVFYQRGLDDEKAIYYKGSVSMTSSEARAMASAMLSAATELKAAV